MLRAFGSTFAGEIGAPEPVGGWLAPGDRPPDVGLELVDEPDSGWSGPCDPPRAAVRRVDGRRVDIERGRDGDLRIEWQGAGRFRVAPGAGRVLCGAPDGPGPAWLRFVLDSVFSIVALARGAVALHAGSVVLDGRAVAVAAGQGGGKTSLLAELAARGAVLLADDVTVVGAGLDAEPGPPVMNVALDRPFPPRAEELGSVLAVLGDEAWVAVPVAAQPAPLAAVVVLDRSAPDGPPDVRALPASPRPLLAMALNPGIDASAQERMFTRLADVAASVPILHLRATPGTGPAALADALVAAIGNHGAARFSGGRTRAT